MQLRTREVSVAAYGAHVAHVLSASSAKLTLEQWRQQRAEAEAGLEALISAIRREFRLPEFPIRLRLDPSVAADAEEAGGRTASA